MTPVVLLLPLLLVAIPAQALTETYIPRASDYIFYTLAFSGICFSAALILAYREYRWLGYTVFSALLVLNAAAMDGGLAYLLGGGDFVLWVLPFLIYGATAAFGYALVERNLETGHRLKVLKPVLRALTVLTALIPLSTPLWLYKIPLSAMWIPLNTLFFVMVVCQALPPLTWHAHSRSQQLILRLFPLVVGVYTLSAFLTHFFILSLHHTQINTLQRIVLILFSGFSLTVVILQAFQSARARESAERQALIGARNEAELQLALQQSEQEYTRAKTLATHSHRQLASVSHDLKQPISALRSAIEEIEHPQPGQGPGRLASAVDYIESLAQAYIQPDTETISAAQQDPELIGSSHQDKEQVPANVYAQTLTQMFSEEADRRGIALEIESPDFNILAEPLANMRVMSNLVANALSHADAQQVSVTFKDTPLGTLFRVYDNGRGMTQESLQQYLQAGSKGKDSKGEGLGLGIVQALCEQQGSTLQIRTRPGRGTIARVMLNTAYP